MVAREEVNPEYFTISASGVVHLQAGARAEFSPLGEWMREKSIFNVFTRMKFFKHYLVYKCYHSWRSSVRQKLFAQVRARLTRRLFLAKPTFCPSLMELAAYVDELRDVQMLVTGQGQHDKQPSVLDDFAEAQTNQRTQKALPALESVYGRMEVSVRISP